MCGRMRFLSALMIGLFTLAGCASPRFVQMDQGGGIVALRENTNVWPTYYRDKAATMIGRKCPNGYEIVREEEVATGTVSHTNSQTDTREAPSALFGGGNNRTEKSGKQGERSSSTFGGIAVPLGETQQTTQRTTTVRDVTEWRIYYRAR